MSFVWIDDGPEPREEGRMRARLIEYALKMVGTVEEHGNRGPRVDEWNRAVGNALGSPWCAAFVWSMYQAVGAGDLLLKSGSCSAIYRWARRHGNLTRSPRGGDVMLLRGGPTGHRHCGIVKGAFGPFVRVIEGNTVPEGGRESSGVIDGGGVRLRNRLKSSCDFVSVLP